MALSAHSHVGKAVAGKTVGLSFFSHPKGAHQPKPAVST